MLDTLNARKTNGEAYPAFRGRYFSVPVGRMPLSGARLVTFRDYSAKQNTTA
ncbi:hypothetical protein KCP77_03755 [Salmonella enterica subsp. enterica]|nr:hypothetical protein KCP77_03755 [Salmonella enterica subsp. enterica]